MYPVIHLVLGLWCFGFEPSGLRPFLQKELLDFPACGFGKMAVVKKSGNSISFLNSEVKKEIAEWAGAMVITEPFK